MSKSAERKSLVIMSLVAILIVSATYFISFIAKGYQLSFSQGPVFKATGLLSATSKPKSASVYINDRLITATDDTINLPPGDYAVKIVKDGYLPWEKTIKIKKEVVYQTDTQLYSSVPDLKPITLSGAVNPALSPDGSKIIYSIASASASKDNGLYVIELNDNLLPLGRNAPRQIAPNFPGIDWSKFTFTFSPNSQSVIATQKTPNESYLLSIDTPINQKNLTDATFKLPLIQEEWKQQTSQIINSKISKAPEDIKKYISTDSAKYISFSSTEDKILYLAKTDGQIKDHLIDAPPAQSTQTQSRNIKKDNYYIYDLKDDTNFLIGSKEAIYNPVWLPNSTSIIFVEGNDIKVIEYDATNKQTLFAGNFNHDVVFPWSDGSRIVTLTSAYSGAQENLYSVSIR